ncbi:MAG: toprim domain-containing protein [Promethearchaeota archaeon]
MNPLRNDLFIKRQEKLLDLFEELAKENKPILVEGHRDRDALITGGIPETLIFILHGSRLLDVEDKIMSISNKSNQEVILLFDFDKEGLKLQKRFKSNLVSRGLRVNTRYWKKIKAIFDGHIDYIETLKKYLECY